MGSAKLLALVLKTLVISGALCTNSTSVPLNVGAKGATGPPNLVFIVCDQLRFDAIGHVQRRRLDYKGKTLIETPNIDELAESGAWFKTAYWYVRGRYPCPRYGPKTNQLSTFSKILVPLFSASASPSCAPSRACFRTGNTLQRAAIKGNKMVQEKVWRMIGFIRDRVSYTYPRFRPAELRSNKLPHKDIAPR